MSFYLLVQSLFNVRHISVRLSEHFKSSSATKFCRSNLRYRNLCVMDKRLCISSITNDNAMMLLTLPRISDTRPYQATQRQGCELMKCHKDVVFEVVEQQGR